ncbi:sigma-54 dependent transcriptional regulator [bacterium]|nr:sigma-54 dependent transcriptional regulator [bacterium]
MNIDGGIFKVLVVCDSQTWTILQPVIMKDKFFTLIHQLIPDTSSEEPTGIDLVLFAVHPSQLSRILELKRSWLLKSEAAVISDNLHAHEVVCLVRAGFAEVFDRQEDIDLLREWLISRYEDAILRFQKTQSKTNRKPVTLIHGVSEGIIRVKKMAVQAAQYSDLTVLIQGETGTGKEMVARLIHESSPRYNRPFIEVNCSAIPESLMEAEMLGYEKGAFTDARRSKRGFFELAAGGTLFLDEIGVMPMSLQNKILKIVEEKKFRRLGGETEITVDVKILAGSNEDLNKAAVAGRFRPDLLYRLKVFTIHIPALRDRSMDIPVLTDYFLKQVSERYKLKISGFHSATQKLLQNYKWPGNVRELKHIVERACVLAARGRILPSHIPEEIQSMDESTLSTLTQDLPEENKLCIPLPEEGIALDDIERLVVQETLKRCDGNQSKAARYLRISRTRLIRKLPGNNNH